MKEFLNFPSPMLASCPLPWHPPLVWAEACSAPPCLLSLAVTGYRCSFCFKPLTCLTPVGILHRDHSLAVLSEDREGGGGCTCPADTATSVVHQCFTRVSCSKASELWTHQWRHSQHVDGRTEPAADHQSTKPCCFFPCAEGFYLELLMNHRP